MLTLGACRAAGALQQHLAPGGDAGAAAPAAGARCARRVRLLHAALLLGFLLPAALLLRMGFLEGDAQFGARFVELAHNSFVLAAITAVVAVLLAVLLAYAARLARFCACRRCSTASSDVGYAVPAR